MAQTAKTCRSCFKGEDLLQTRRRAGGGRAQGCFFAVRRSAATELLGLLRAGLGERRFVLAVQETKTGELEVRGVVVLRDPSGERLTADAMASAIVQERVVNSQVAREAEVRFRFSGHGNGVNLRRRGYASWSSA